MKPLLQVLHTIVPVPLSAHTAHSEGQAETNITFSFSAFSQHFDGLMQERRNSIALAMELRLSCTNPSTHRFLNMLFRLWLKIDEGSALFHYWPLWGNPLDHRWIPLTKGQQYGPLILPFVFGLNNMLNKQSSCQWFQTPGHSWCYYNASQWVYRECICNLTKIHLGNSLLLMKHYSNFVQDYQHVS